MLIKKHKDTLTSLLFIYLTNSKTQYVDWKHVGVTPILNLETTTKSATIDHSQDF